MQTRKMKIKNTAVKTETEVVLTFCMKRCSDAPDKSVPDKERFFQCHQQKTSNRIKEIKETKKSIK